MALVLWYKRKTLGLDNEENLTNDEIKKIMSLYNGSGDWAEKYGNVTIEYYEAFKKYNQNEKEYLMSIIKKIFKHLFIGICIVFIIFGVVFFILIFVEEESPYSEYDECFVNSSNEILLEASELNDIQTEVLAYVNDWKMSKELSHINVYLNEKYEIRKINFVYKLDDVENYDGILDVYCYNRNGKWILIDARSLYFYDDSESQEDTTNTKEYDLALNEKVKQAIKYIKNSDKPRQETYILGVYTDSVHIDAHSKDSTDISDFWEENIEIK